MSTTAAFVTAWIASRPRAEVGASLLEYGLLVAVIAVVCIAAVKAFG